MISDNHLNAVALTGRYLSFTLLKQLTFYKANYDGPNEYFRCSDGEIESMEWSPKGDRIAYIQQERDKTYVKLINPFTEEQKKFSVIGSRGDFGSYNDLAWSPDSKSITLRRFSDSKISDSYVIDVQSGKRRSANDVELQVEAWSPDGKHAIYKNRNWGCEFDPGAWTAVGIMNADGLHKRTLVRVEYPLIIYSPRWSPDSKSIAFVQFDYYAQFDHSAQTYTAYTVDIKSRKKRKIADGVKDLDWR